MLPAASVVKPANAWLPPTESPNVVAPLALTVSVRLLAALSAFTVFSKVAVVPATVTLLPRVTSSLKSAVPALTDEPLIAVLPAASVVRLDKGLTLPTRPPKVVAPAVFTWRL